jgi:hypothetical protein
LVSGEESDLNLKAKMKRDYFCAYYQG